MNSGNKNPAMMGLFLGVDGSQIAAAVKTIEMFDVQYINQLLRLKQLIRKSIFFNKSRI